MTLQIKQRIEQIRRGEVPEGYKKTKVGAIPSEWIYDSLEKYLIQHHETSDYSDQYPVLTSSRKGIYLQSDYYNHEVASENNTGYNVVPRGYFTYRHMSDDEIFKFNINTIVDKGIVSTLYPVFTTKNIDDYFLQTVLNEGREFRRFAILQKQGGSRTYMYFDKLKKLKVCLPPLVEQEKIAEILSAQDKLIALKEKLIEEKKRQKKTLIKKILNDKSIKSKFSAHWNTVELKDIFDYIQPTKYLVENTDYSDDYATPVLTAGKSFILGYTNETHGIFDQVPVVIFDDFTTDSKYVDFPFKAKSSAMKILMVKERFDIRFAFELLQNIDYIVGGHERHWISVFSQMTVDVPSYEAQQEIGQIIQCINSEIDLLQKDLDQEKQKKKALMQLLLTGIVRV